MKSELLKYKHYLIVILALLCANYLIIPLYNWQEEQQQVLLLLNKKENKIISLLSNRETFEQDLKKSIEDINKLQRYVFIENSESAFKLKSQAIVEKAVLDAGCTIERIGLKGNTELPNEVERWFLEVRYKGNIDCLVKTTRALEIMTPMIKIDSYNINHRALTEEVHGNFNAKFDLSVWFLEKNT